MLEKLSLELRNCYGIGSLKSAIDFTKDRTASIYAPNGVMKSSLALTIQDIEKTRETKDRVYSDRETTRVVVDQSGNDLAPESIFVVEPYDDQFRSERVSTLLVNQELRKRYVELYEKIEKLQQELVSELKKTSGIRSGVESELSRAFTASDDEFITALGRLQREIENEGNDGFAGFKYSSVFGDKILKFLESPDAAEKIAKYAEIYDSLIENSRYFRKGVFNHNNAAAIAKNLKDNGWFDSGHTVSLKTGSESQEISSQVDLEEAIELEMQAIVEDPDLRGQFDELDKDLKKNKDLRDFRELLANSPELIPELKNVASLKQKFWIAYVRKVKPQYVSFMEAFDAARKEIDEIVEQAKRESTRWQTVLKIFNSRFTVPFSVSMENQEDVILRSDVPKIRFEFQDSNVAPRKKVDENTLIAVLSNGEKRALYILNIIFEVEARVSDKQETLFLFDDIADSFDYKNKYAIIEYLHDVAGQEFFCQILLSHNFDFFRSVSGRLNLPRENRLHAIKNGNEIVLDEEKYQNNPFVHWKKHLSNERCLIASIPFVRNLAEFCGNDNVYQKLTSVLHIKADTRQIKLSDLKTLFLDVLCGVGDFEIDADDRLVIDAIHSNCEQIAGSDEESIDLENKIVLSIGVRLGTESHLLERLENVEESKEITRNQTYELIRLFKHHFGNEDLTTLELVQRVNLMTPENIHLNSFMYEPILDLSPSHLKTLYLQVSELG